MDGWEKEKKKDQLHPRGKTQMTGQDGWAWQSGQMVTQTGWCLARGPVMT